MMEEEKTKETGQRDAIKGKSGREGTLRVSEGGTNSTPTQGAFEWNQSFLPLLVA